MLSCVIEEWNDAGFRFLALPTWKFGFLILKTKTKSCSSNYSLESLILNVYNPHQGKVVAFLPYQLIRLHLEPWVVVKRNVCFAYFVKSKSRSKKKQVIHLDQDVRVCGYFWWMMDEAPCHEPSISFFVFL